MQCDLHPKHGVQCSRAEDDASYTAIPLTFEEFFVCFSVVCDWCMIDLVPVILAMHYLLHTFLCVCVCVSLSVCGFFRVFLGVGSLHFRSKNSLIRLHAAPLRCSNWRLRIEIGSSSVGAACLPACLPAQGSHTQGRHSAGRRVGLSSNHEVQFLFFYDQAGASWRRYVVPGLIQTFHILRELLCFDEVVVSVIVFLVRFCVAITNRPEPSSTSSSSFCVQLPPVLFLFAHRADLIHLPLRSYTSSRK